jgi:integrase
MAKVDLEQKVKEPVRLRKRLLADGRTSLFLDIYFKGKRSYKFLSLYLVPELDFRDKIANGNTMERAIAYKNEVIYEITNKIAGISDSERKAKMAFADWMQEYMEHVESKGKDVAWIKSVIAELQEFDPNIKLADVNRDFLVKFMDRLLTRKPKRSKKRDHISKTTVFMYMEFLRAGLNYAVKERVLHSSPYKLINRSMVSMDEHMRVYLTVEEVTQLIKTPCLDQELKRVFLFSCFTGLRIQDIRDLKWKHISKQGEVWQIEIIQFKTKQQLYLPLNLSARKWLPEQGNAKLEDAIFPNLTRYYGDPLRKWVKEAGITKDVTMHVGRHTFATMMLTLDVDLYTVSKLLGHSKITTTQIYAKNIDKKRVDAVSKVDGIF